MKLAQTLSILALMSAFGTAHATAPATGPLSDQNKTNCPAMASRYNTNGPGEKRQALQQTADASGLIPASTGDSRGQSERPK
jgi:hypothetical protein